MYCYFGYYAVCFLGDEVIDPSRNLPRSMIISVITVAVIFYTISLSIVGVVPWKEAAASQFVASEFMQAIYGKWAGVTITILILWTAFASTCGLLFAYSRVPYAAARDGNFFSIFSRLHAEKDFPHYSLLLIGGLTVVSSFFALDEVIKALMTARILVQFVGQIVALAFLRKFRPEVPRPFKMYLYPLPAAVAFFGWGYVFLSAGTKYIAYGLLTLAFGGVAFIIMSKKRRSWPFAVAPEG
jgi:amino acid transporter